MNPHLQNILNLIQQDESLTAEQKNAIAQTLKDVDKELQIITFKLDRTEKVKRTTAILLEETIEELEQKRKDVEAQNKELEIESALERVRTIAMSMNRLEDMVDVCRIISQQLELLNVKEIRNVQTAIFYEQKAVYMDYEYYAKHDKTFITEVDYTNHDVGKTFAHQMLKGPGEVYTHGFTGKEVLDWYEYQKTTNVFIDTYLETATSLNYYWFSLGPIALGISTYHPLNESEINLFKRFLKVFELSYRRYLDIEKAIAQAREAKIEAALEKVRSRSLAMHKSDELNEVVMVLFERLKDLQIPVTAVGIHVFSEGSKDLNVYVCGDIGNGLAINNYLLPYFNHPIADDLYDAHEKGLDFFVGNYSKKQKNSFYKHVFEHSALRDLPDDIKSMIFQSEFYSITMAPVKNSVITVNDFEGKPLSDAEADVVKRFAKVFEQAYIRFLDLQKAESQARESQIQLAMERVRARTMAMQRSEELADVATVLFQQVKSLGVSQWTCGFNIWEVGDKEYTFYPGSPDGDILPPCKVPLTEHPVFIQMDESRRRGDELYVYEKTGEIQADHYRYMHALPGIGDLLQSMLDAGLSFPTFQIDHLANFSHGNLVFITYEPVPEMHDVFKRFAKVFEQTYTRFLDLQKAEAQARESQVQLAMERVRARTMAMQHSSELADAATLLLTQVRDLGIKTFGAGFNIWQPDGLSVTSYMANPDGSIQPPFSLPHNENPYFIKISDARQRGEHFFVMESGGEELEEMRRYMLNLPGIKEIVGDTVTSGDQWPKFQVNHCAFFSQGYLLFITYEPVPEMWDIFKRFAKVFEQTYTRFLDLQKAEAQARESQIQLALERVRARTMAMQKSDELPEAANLLFQQVQSLGMPAWSAGYCIWSEDQPTGQAGKKSITAWMSSEGILQPPFKAPTTEDELFIQMRKGSEQGKTFHVVEMGGEKLVAHYQYMRTLPVVSEVLDSIIEAGHPLPTFQIMHQAYFTQGFLLFITYEPVPEAHDIFKRFAKVFEQTYTRFLDLQKAEAQAREAKIETALEKVRSRTMAMQRSDELGDVAEILFKQVKELGIHPWTTGFNIWQEGNDAYIDWITNPSGGFVEPYTVDLTTHPIFREISNAKKRGEEFQVFDLSGEPLAETYALLMGFAPKQFEGFLSSGFSFPTRQFNHYVYGAQVGLMFITPEPCPEAHDIFKRFGKVFEQTYTRFLDLQKAEAQTREAHIEAALERVRSRTMAMYQSNELAETAHVLFEQFRDLGENPERMAIGIVNEEEEVIEIWATQHGGTLMNSMYKFTIDEPHVMNKLYTAWKKQESVTLDLKGNELEEYFQFLKNAGALVDRKAFGDRRVQMAAFFSKGLLMTISPEPRPSGTLSLLERFAAVFNLTYTRFLDLQKAEAQTREAIIEASLEKVRGKAMAMHDSKDLSSTAIMVFTELQKLGIKPFRNGVGILSKDSRKGQLYSATSSNEIDSLALVGWVELSGHPILEKIYDSWYANEDYFPILEGEQLKTYYEHLSAGFSIPSAPNRQPEEKQYGHFIAFSIGSVYSWASKPYTEEEIKILKRFAAIIDLTFRRYLELQHSEANAKEAIKQSSLDRVRAEIASMRTVDDLSHITPIVWRELTTLGVPFFRCGIYIIKEDEQLVHMYLSTPEGKSLAVLHLPFTGAEITIQTVHHWRKQQIYSTHWDRDQFIAWVKTLQGQGQVQSVESYQGAQAPPESLTLQFIPFTQGMLYIGSADALNEDQFSLAKELANAFSVAYARYEDFKKLEEAKSKIETTLSDLKAAQSQLVQSEKMASLGELTAGIAHEIQNPLNFVNNFADINNELIKELVEATSSELRDAGNEADIIATIKENSEKINYHGKRAESIVRGMLQHSRKSAGIKEPTDINALADEYMRLSYHGLRAKDKSFNAEFKIDLDPSLPLINVIPQDVGRVFLNLFNNAFWACAERGRLEIGKRKMENASSDLPSPISDLPFSPLVTLTTKNLLDHIEIHISDNGPGIPSNIIDKIFQPFFTTKPTGQGTGLGLSLAYDIIKAHIGELKVETKVGQGSVFTILLPVT